MGYDLNQAHKRKDDPSPASRKPYEQPDDPDYAAIQVAKARGLDPAQVLAERRRVLKPKV